MLLNLFKIMVKILCNCEKLGTDNFIKETYDVDDARSGHALSSIS